MALRDKEGVNVQLSRRGQLQDGLGAEYQHPLRFPPIASIDAQLAAVLDCNHTSYNIYDLNVYVVPLFTGHNFPMIASMFPLPFKYIVPCVLSPRKTYRSWTLVCV